jgi:hypothetical protein
MYHNYVLHSIVYSTCTSDQTLRISPPYVVHGMTSIDFDGKANLLRFHSKLSHLQTRVYYYQLSTVDCPVDYRLQLSSVNCQLSSPLGHSDCCIHQYPCRLLFCPVLPLPTSYCCGTCFIFYFSNCFWLWGLPSSYYHTYSSSLFVELFCCWPPMACSHLNTLSQASLATSCSPIH